MLKATVTGAVWATRRLPEIPAGAFLEVETEEGARLVAFDVLGSGVGERVLIATGSVASGWFGADHPPLDALIIGSLDEDSEPRPTRGDATTTSKRRQT
jgi:ethanolamine utilization protein EutN